MGMMIYQFREKCSKLDSIGGVIAVGGFVIAIFVYVTAEWADYVTVPAGIVFLVYAISDNDSNINKIWRWKIIYYIGEISYSTYLSHYFIKDWVKFVLVNPGIDRGIVFAVYLIVTALASVALYRWIEVPGRRTLRRLTLRAFPQTP